MPKKHKKARPQRLAIIKVLRRSSEFHGNNPKKRKVSAQFYFLSTAIMKKHHKLLNIEEVPLAFHEVSIVSGYRQTRCTPSDCVRSTLYPFNNETINFWTHFIPFWFFIYHLCMALTDARTFYMTPYICFMMTVCAWPLASAMAHIFCVMSVHARHICFMFDYAALSCYSFGSAVAYHAYSFNRSYMATRSYEYYPYIAASAAIFCTATSCYTRLMPKGRRFWLRKYIRSTGFFVPYVVVNYPLFRRIVEHLIADDWSNLPNGVVLHIQQMIAIIIAFTFYNTHWPERQFPGTFDLIGQSHQIFHCFGIAATYFQMMAITSDLNARRSFIESAHARGFIGHLGRVDLLMFASVILINLLIIGIVARLLPTYKNPHSEIDGLQSATKLRKLKGA